MFVQKPLFSRGLLALLGLLIAVSVFATVITVALSSVVHRSAADRDLALQVAQARTPPRRPARSAIAGSVIELTTGAPLAGVSVEAFTADDTAEPLVTTATTADGTFAVDRLPAGDYALRVRAPGSPRSGTRPPPRSRDAHPRDRRRPGATVDGLVVVVGGVPATVSGTVVGDDVAGGVVRGRAAARQRPAPGTGGS